MSSINKIKLPDGVEYEINDVRIPSDEIPAAIFGSVSNGHLVEWSGEHQALIDSDIDITNYINPAVPGIKIGAWTDEILAGKVDLSLQKLVFDTSILTSAQLMTTVFSTTGGYQLTGSVSQQNQFTYIITSYLVNPDSSTTLIGGAMQTSYSGAVEWGWNEGEVVQRTDGLYEFTLPADFGTIIPESVTVTATDLQAFSYITHNMSELIGDALLLNNTLISAPVASGTIATQEWVQEQGYGSSNLNLKNGEGACSLEQSFEEDGTVKGSKAYGKYATALNQNNGAYQRNSFVTGGGSEVGLTEEEFNEKYPNGVDEWDTTYDKSNSFANAGGQENKVKGRGSHIGGGYQNEVYGNYSGIVAGGSNIIEGTYSGVVAGYNNHVNGNNSGLLDGDNNLISGNNSGAGGVNNVVETDNTHAFGANLISNKRPDATMVGRYNNDKSYALFQVGSGWYNEETGVTHRRNSFEVFENGVNQFNEPVNFVSKVDFSKSTGLFATDEELSTYLGI